MSSWVTGCELLRLKRSKTPLPRVTQEERLKGGHQLSGGFPGGLEVKASGESHGRRSLVGYSPWGRKESDTTERLHFTSLHQLFNGDGFCELLQKETQVS